MDQQMTHSQLINDHDMSDDILAQLMDIFGNSVPQDVIVKTGQEHQWKLDECVERLMNFDDADLLIESEEFQEPTMPPVMAQVHTAISAAGIAAIERAANAIGITADVTDAASTVESVVRTNVPANAVAINQPTKYTGAIPKNTVRAQQLPSQPIPLPSIDTLTNGQSQNNGQFTSFSSFLQNSQTNQFVDNFQPYNNIQSQPNIAEHPEFRGIVHDINQGYRIMIVMRGAPGSGKSHLAKSIIDTTMNGDYDNHIFSTDDFFYDKKTKRYVYNRDFLDAAHNANQAKVTQRALNGWSPIIVDNTNMKLWEMVPYVREGVRNGYLIKILESNTPWAKSSGRLASRNKHNVPKLTIDKMLTNYEPTTLFEFLTLMKLEYGVQVPIRRVYPPTDEATISNPTIGHKNVRPDDSKVQRKRRQPLQQQTQNQAVMYTNVVENDESNTLQIAAEQIQSVNNQWAAFDPEQGVVVPWDTETKPQPKSAPITNPREQRAKPAIPSAQPDQLNGSIFNLLRDRYDGSATTNGPDKEKPDEPEVHLEKHEKGCTNENKLFQQIRLIYPSISISFLWDLFEKCNGDGDWTMDILLKDEDTTANFAKLKGHGDFIDNFTCNCKSGRGSLLEAANAIPSALLMEHPELAPTPPSLTPTRSRQNRIETETESEIRRQIEEQFNINDEFYSPHVRKMREIRHGTASSPQDMDIDDTICNDEAAAGGETILDGEELIEMDLGVEFVCQLDTVFGVDAFQRDSLKDIKTTVFMPRSLGQQLYALWMESLYNQIEENRQRSVRDDEEFAKQLQLKEKYPKAMQKTTPNNLNDIMQMEYAWKAYKAEVDEWKNSTPQDLASQMTRSKLFEIFPSVNRETLVEVLAAHDNKFAKTVEVLKDSLGSDINNQVEVESQRLLNQARIEVQAIRPEAAGPSKQAIRALEAKKLGPEEAKKAALRDFEENRNMAQHHSQMKGECYTKAREAFQRHDGQVAYYYTNVANLHKNKIDMYNQRAANAIVEVHQYTQKNPDMLDLHYLHSAEAVECLDIFLDKQINLARSRPRNFKYVFVITGRGLHSAGGISTIKLRVKARLKERYLSWAEVNPGLLKVRLQGNSAFSQDV